MVLTRTSDLLSILRTVRSKQPVFEHMTSFWVNSGFGMTRRAYGTYEQRVIRPLAGASLKSKVKRQMWENDA